MANLREIRTRMKSMENTSQITASMKMIAAAKLRKAQTSFESLRNYAEQCGQMLTEASAGVWDHDNPYLTPHPVCRKVCYVLVVGNRGMCGAYNQNLLRYYENLVKDSEEESLLLVCGRWGRDLIAAAGLQEDERLELSDTPTREEAMQLAEKLMKLYRDETADRIERDVPKMNGLFTVDNLKYLARTGRIKNYKALAGNLLNIKPILRGDKDGFIVEFGKVRGRRKSLQTITGLLISNIMNPDEQIVGIAHADAYEEALEIAKEIKNAVKVKDIIITSYDLCTGSHVGPDTIALFFLARDRELSAEPAKLGAVKTAGI